jgi:hypothetical protein
LSTSYSRSKIHADVLTNGDWRKRNEDDITETYKLEAAHIFQDRWQGGVSIPYQKRIRSGAQAGSSSGLGDISFQMGYEFLPDWDYNIYRPKGIIYLSLIAPTGRSIYESSDGSGIDARGRGFWGLGVGTVLVKQWGPWDANTNFEFHYLFSKKVNNNVTNGVVRPGHGASAAVGGGWNWKEWRLGGLINWIYEASTDVSGTTASEGGLKRYAVASFPVSYMLSQDQSFILSYSDQTLFGSPYNVSLSRSISLFYQLRWGR